MIGLVLRRLGQGVFVMWGAVTFMFALIRLAPGNPAALLLGPDASAAQIAALSRQLGFDGPVLVQYFNYISQVAHLNFGASFLYEAPAMTVVLSRLGATVQLTLAATVIAVAVGLTLGLIASRRPDSRVDRTVSGFSILLQGMPTFWVGIMLILIFALDLRWLPSSGYGSLSNLVLPAITLALPFTAIVSRISRSTLTESMREPYIQTALSKGLTPGQALWGHAMRNSMAPVVNIVGLQMGALLGGAVIVENVFAWPGLGSLIIQAVSGRDYSVVQAAVLLIALIVVVLNLLADIVSALLNPRVRAAASA